MSFNPIHAALSSQRRLGGFHQTNFGIPFERLLRLLRNFCALCVRPHIHCSPSKASVGWLVIKAAMPCTAPALPRFGSWCRSAARVRRLVSGAGTVGLLLRAQMPECFAYRRQRLAGAGAPSGGFLRRMRLKSASTELSC